MMQSNYDKFPRTKIKGFENQGICGYTNIVDQIKKQIKPGRYVVVVDTYPGVDDEEVLPQLQALSPAALIEMRALFKEEKTLNEQLRYQLTEDRVFGKMYFGDLTDFLDMEILQSAQEKLRSTQGLVIIYGFGASLLEAGDLRLYLDLARWEIQLRYRGGMTNYKCDNPEEDILKKYKRAFFVEWRIADKHKALIFDTIDYFIDTNKKNAPKMVSGDALRAGLRQIASQPFRTVPYFDSGVWGGQWMKKVCDLDPGQQNYAWSFDGVPEENSLLLDFGNALLEIPAMDLVLYQPKQLLGQQVFARFGAEFPIRFDFLDTMGGQNLSLQVHPLTEYIKKQFGMNYTQDESYYILDAKEDAVVYLGLKEGIDRQAMLRDLQAANRKELIFDAEQYINKFPAKKHDHFLIPAGTCHCSGNNAMVLEVSATPYIFTFKLWDWGRLGLDGRPRPVHLAHGEQVIQWDRTTAWVEKNLVNAIVQIKTNDDFTEEHTGLHELEFIETRRYWIRSKVVLETKDTVHMLNLIEGREAVVESPTNAFAPFIVHYAETFIIPAQAEAYSIRPHGESAHEQIGVLCAYVRNSKF